MNGPRRGYAPPMAGKKLDKAVLGRLLSYIKLYRGRFILVLACIAVSALTGVASALFMGSLVDDYIAPLLLMKQADYSNLLVFLMKIAAIFLAGAVSSFFSNFLMIKISQGILLKLRKQIFEHLQEMPLKYFDTHKHGETMSLFTNDADTLNQMISQSIPQMFSALISIISVLVTMLGTSWLLTLVVLSMTALSLFVVKSRASKSADYFRKRQKAIATVDGYIEEMMNGQKVIKVFTYEDEAIRRFDQLNEDLRTSSYQANAIANTMMPIMGNLGNLQYVLIAIVGGLIAFNPASGLSIGMIITFLQLSRNFNRPISQVSQQINSIFSALAGAKRIFDFLDEKKEGDDGYVTMVRCIENEDGSLSETSDKTGIWAWKHPHQSDGSITYTPIQGDVRFFDVDFEYESGKRVLDDISLYAKPGQKIALVGSTGAGKTTITNLITRFYDIADGKIRYDGININKIRKPDLRHSMGMVLQDVNLFTGTVMENIRFGNPEATDQMCIEAAKLANADGFIRNLSQGYNTMLTGEGSGLSQGQRQLLSIARAAVLNPPVMILDEATSSIDTHTEALVQAGMDALMKGRTVFVIAHRLSTVQNADVIMVLEKGSIIERGSHNELMEKKGRYYQLYTGNAS